MKELFYVKTIMAMAILIFASSCEINGYPAFTREKEEQCKENTIETLSYLVIGETDDPKLQQEINDSLLVYAIILYNGCMESQGTTLDEGHRRDAWSIKL